VTAHRHRGFERPWAGLHAAKVGASRSRALSAIAIAATLLAGGPSIAQVAPGGGQPAGASAEPGSNFVPSAYDWRLPAWAPAPLEPKSNPTTQEKVELGRRLFYDGRLAADSMRSCASCHTQERAFSDISPVSWGVTGQQTARNTMALSNVGYAPVLTWANPQVRTLEVQALTPMFGQHPIEMGMMGLEDELLTRLRTEPSYPALFAKAFPEAGGALSLDLITKAIAAFERTLISVRSPYDRFRQEGERSAISAAAIRGEALFFGPRLNCGACHGGLHLGGGDRSSRNPAGEPAFHNTGLYNLDGNGAYPPQNIGSAANTGRPEDVGRFKTPSLRNIAVTAPYMHDGSIATLDGVIDHYAAGGRTITVGAMNAGAGRDSPLKSPLVAGFTLTLQERTDLIAFLQSLTDDRFLTDPRHSNPWKQGAN